MDADESSGQGWYGITTSGHYIVAASRRGVFEIAVRHGTDVVMSWRDAGGMESILEGYGQLDRLLR